MIVDIGNEVFTRLKTELGLAGVMVSADYDPEKPTFPLVTFVESSNTTHGETVDSAGENHNEVTFEINIYCNKVNKRTQAKSIRNIVDGIMSDEYGLDRGFSGETPNFLDSSIYRYTLRYTGVVSESKQIYRR